MNGNAAIGGPADAGSLRLALMSTPRSGNTWLRGMLASTLDLQELAVHDPYALDWGGLPPRVIVHLHWLRDEALAALFEQHGFRVVVISRHPLDMLISLLVYAQHGRETMGWLGGLAGDERELEGASPLDAGFLNYATGDRARALLNVGAQWWLAPGAGRVRYEDLIDDTPGHLARLLAELQLQPRRPLSEAIDKCTPDQMRGFRQSSVSRVASAAGSLETLAARSCRTKNLPGPAIGVSILGLHL